MFYSSSKNKSVWPAPSTHRVTKLPSELVEHLKSTGDVPKKSKENHNPREGLNVHPDIKIEHKGTTSVKDASETVKLSKSKIIEADISQIASSYVLEGNMLKKKQVYEAAIKKTNKSAPLADNPNAQPRALDRKELLKLEYLEKMGFLRPDEQSCLAEHRKTHPQQSPTEGMKKTPNTNLNQSMRTEYPAESLNYLPLYSPKNMDPKMLPQLYSSTGKFVHSHLPYF